jgi:hypothetical protein
MKTEGNAPDNLPLPYHRKDLAGRLFLTHRKRHYIVDVWPHWSDGELVWEAFRWTGQVWLKIPSFTRAAENRYPKTIAKAACDFHQRLSQSA